jgi:hypothetical protein
MGRMHYASISWVDYYAGCGRVDALVKSVGFQPGHNTHPQRAMTQLRPRGARQADVSSSVCIGLANAMETETRLT